MEKPASVHKDDKARYKAGFMVKQGAKVKNWKRRFFVLDKAAKVLYYYSDPEDQRPKGRIVIERRTIEDAEVVTKKPFCFQIAKENQRTYYICCDDETSKESWMSELKFASTTLDQTMFRPTGPARDTNFRPDNMSHASSSSSSSSDGHFPSSSQTPHVATAETTLVGKDPDDTLNFDDSGQILLRDTGRKQRAPSLTLIAMTSHFQTIQAYVWQPVLLGRHTNELENQPNFIQFLSNVVSRKHAQIFVVGEEFYIQDLGSQGGTYLNTLRLSPEKEKGKAHKLRDGDVIQLGVDLLTGPEPWLMAVRMRVHLAFSDV